MLLSTFLFIVKVLFFIGIIYAGHRAWDYTKDQYSKPIQKKRYANELDEYKRMIETMYQPPTDFPSNNTEDDLVAYMNLETQKLMNQTENHIEPTQVFYTE
jgi:hypothetical protein